VSTISANVVKELRDITGAGMMDCKRALQECNGDAEAAKDWLRKRGQAIADKKSTRKASEGLVFHTISDDGRTAAMLELNCETDFVARNEAFPKLGRDLVAYASTGAPGADSGNVDEFLAAPNPREASTTVQDLLKQNIATLGENLGIGRLVRVQAAQPTSYLHIYIHHTGKLGVIVELAPGKAESRDNAAFKEFASDVAMQVASATPEFLDRSQVTQEQLDRELAIYKDQARNEGKPDNLLDKIAQGKIGKYYSQVCLIEQIFVKDGDLTIQKLADKVGKEIGDSIKIVRFERIKIGA